MGQKLIDAEEFEELFNKQIEYGATDIIAAVYDALQDTLTVDDVPVVHCSECKQYTVSNRGYMYCKRWDVDDYQETHVEPYDFCSYGERKEGAE